MLIKVVLYGGLIQKKQTKNPSAPKNLEIENRDVTTVSDILKKLQIEENEISHVFVNHKYCGLGKRLKDKDRVAIFPRKMALMFVEIPHSNSIEITVKLSNELTQYGPEESKINLPEGSYLRKLFEKYNITENPDNLSVLINGEKWHDKNMIIKNGDVVSISLI